MKRDIAKEHAESCELLHHHEDLVKKVEVKEEEGEEGK